MDGFKVFVVLLSVFALLISFGSLISDPVVDETGWVEFIDGVYNSSNRLVVGSTLVNFSMDDYSVRSQELPTGVTVGDWFNGTHILTNRAGSSFIYRWRYSAEPQSVNTYCQIFYDIGGSVGQLPARLITFPKGVGIEQIGTFTNLEYTLDTWVVNGAVPQIVCNNDVEFWDIQFTIESVHIGRGVY